MMQIKVAHDYAFALNAQNLFQCKQTSQIRHLRETRKKWIVYLVYVNSHCDVEAMSYRDCFDFLEVSCCNSVVIVYSIIYQKAQSVFIVHQREIDVAWVVRKRVSRVSSWLLNYQDIIIHYVFLL